MNPANKYSHQFSIELDSAGGKFCIGYCSVAPDKRKADFQITKMSEPLSLSFYEDAIKLLKMIESLNIKYKGIKCIRFEPAKKE